MTFTVECQHCKKMFTKMIDKKELNGYLADTRSMGEEKHYRIPIKKCPCCKHSLDFINLFEYPEGEFIALAE